LHSPPDELPGTLVKFSLSELAPEDSMAAFFGRCG
jgi:hypothetical protein